MAEVLKNVLNKTLLTFKNCNFICFSVKIRLNSVHNFQTVTGYSCIFIKLFYQLKECQKTLKYILAIVNVRDTRSAVCPLYFLQWIF